MKSWLWITLIILIFLLINLMFNFSLWKELFGTKNLVSDNVITEFVLENSYQQILHLKNPFVTESILFPFETNYSLSDPANSYIVFYFFLHPFLTPHKFIVLVVLVSFFLNNLLMYFLLKKFKINSCVAFLSSLVFGFTPFLSHRVQGHYTYIPIFFFPLAYLIIQKFLSPLRARVRIWLAIGFGIFSGFVLLSNFYYFFMIFLALFFYFIYYLFKDKKILLKIIKENFIYIIISFIVMIIVLTPWLVAAVSQVKLQGMEKSSGYGGAVELSADLFSFITPSEYNPIYKILFLRLESITPLFFKYNHFFLNSWGRFTYPGAIILLIYIVIFVLLLSKKFPVDLWNIIKSFFIISLVFATLMLGPFLKVFNRWSINFDGVAVVFPLPFLLLHYIPGLSTLRAPSRFTPIFVFLACIVAAYTLDFLIKKVGEKKALIIMIFIFIIFFIDQFYAIPTKLNQEIPTKIYSSLRNKPQGTVLEIPFTVRDGFQYIGFVHAIQPMAGQLIHGKPIIGGYIARVPDKVFDYYKNLNFISYLSKIIDKGNYIPLKEKPKDINLIPYPYPIKTAENEVQSLNIKYVVLKSDEKYSNYLVNLFKEIGFVDKLRENNYILLEQ